MSALLVALGLFAALVAARFLRVSRGFVCAVLGTAIWVALLKSGVEPIIAGLAIGLLTYAYPAGRSDLEQATERFRLFREQPTPELARPREPGCAVRGIAERTAATALPPMDELRDRAAVRSRQRRDRHQRRLPDERVRLGDHARHPRSATSSASRWASSARPGWSHV
jgi:Na+/H+ antiporter